VDNDEGNVAARSRALFEQLRALRGRGSAPDEGRAARGAPPDSEPVRAAPPRPQEQAGTTKEPAADRPPEQGGAVGTEPPGAAGESSPGWSDEPGVGPAAPAAGDAASVAVAGPAPGDGIDGRQAPEPEHAPDEPEAPGEGARTPLVDLSGTGVGPILGDPPTAHPPVADEHGRHPAADLPLPRVIAIANQKGGVGKTTTAVNLGAALAELGYRTLIVDLDPQGNATTGLGVNARNLEHAIYDVLMHELPLDECVEPTSVRNLFVAPATIDLAGAEIELVPAFSRELRLRRAVAEVGGEFDFTIIDCPPSLGLLTVNGLAAASEVIVPIQCEYYALEGVSQLLRNVSLVQANLNPTLIVSAIILTMYDARTKLADQVAAEVRQHFGAKVCRNVVPRTVRLSEAPSFGQPIIVFDSSSRGALAYRELAKEVSGGAPQRVG